MQNPLVSIVIPFKNTSNYLPTCLNSIISQSYTHWEVLIVNDHSTDNSYDIVKTYSKNDNRIQLYNNKGSGIINALKLAFSKSKGTFITRMDSDDIMPKNKIEHLCKSLIKHGKSHVATGCVSYFSETGINQGYSNYEKWLNGLTKTGANFSEIYKECVIPSPCWMLYKDDFIACGGFDSDIYPEDYDLTFRFYQKNYKVIPCSSVLHYWRDYASRSSRTDAHYAENSFLDLKLNYFLKLNYNTNHTLVIWGAGKKGKLLAKKLIQRHIDFTWICDNPKKIGKSIYEKTLYPFQHLKTLNQFQSIISVANFEAQKEIKQYFNSLNKIAMVDYFFFC